MIQPINNINFKALWQKHYKYSAEQSRTITEIKAKLGERPFSEDYMIEPGAKEDSVILYKFDNLKLKNGQRLSYEKKNYIGTYNPTQPFMIKDLNEVENFDKLEEKKNKIATIVLIGIGALAVFLSHFLPNKKVINETNKNKIENVIKPAIDSLEIAPKDSLNIIKK